MAKQQLFRDKFQFKGLDSREETHQDQCCLCRQEDRPCLNARFRIIQAEIFSRQGAGSLVDKPICMTCLERVYKVDLSAIRREKKKLSLQDRFSTLYSWLQDHPDLTHAHPTLSHFYNCLDQGKDFPPTLLTEVWQIVRRVKTTRGSVIEQWTRHLVWMKENPDRVKSNKFLSQVSFYYRIPHHFPSLNQLAAVEELMTCS